MHVDDFIKDNTMKLFGRVCTAHKIRKECSERLHRALNDHADKFKIYNHCNSEVSLKAMRVNSFINNNNYNFRSGYGKSQEDEFLDDALVHCEKLGNLNYDILEDVQFIKDYIEGLDIITFPYIDGSTYIEPKDQEAALEAVRNYNSRHKDDPKKLKMLNTTEYHDKTKRNDGGELPDATA